MSDYEEKPHKLMRLWQAYKLWREMRGMRFKHQQRIAAIDRGDSQMDKMFEETVLMMFPFVEVSEDASDPDARMIVPEIWAMKQMQAEGQTAGPIWDWLTDIKGIGPHMAAKLLAQIDDIEKFDTVSKLWRFCGVAVIDGKAERWTEHYNRKLKADLLGEKGVADQFILHQTPVYVDEYYRYKGYLRTKYPEPVEAEEGNWPMKWTDSHINRMAKRKAVKMFLQHLWVKWREFEGLPISKPWVHDIGGHTHYIGPDEE